MANGLYAQTVPQNILLYFPLVNDIIFVFFFHQDTTKVRRIADTIMSIIRVIRKYKMVLSSHQKLRIFELGILMIIGGFLETCSVSLMLPFMNVVMAPEQTMKNHYVQWVCGILHLHSPRTFLVFLAIFLAMIYILKNVYLMFQFNIQYRFVYGNMFVMQKKLLETFVHRPYEHFLKMSSGEVIRVINSDTVSAFNLLITLLSLFTELVVSSMLILTIFVINPLVTTCMAVMMLLLVFFIFMILKPILRTAGLENQKAYAGMHKWLLQSIQGIKELKVMKREAFFQDNYDACGQVFVQTNRRSQILNLIPRFFIEAISMGVMFIVVAVLIYRGSDLESIIPMLTAVAMAAMRLLPSVNRISSSMTSIAYGEPMLDKMIENLRVLENREDVTLSAIPEKNKPAEPAAKEPVSPTIHIPDFSKEIHFRQITYHYPGSKENVLTHASMVIHRGESVGIVGPSGAGKTTSVDIILGLLCPQEGQILVDGVDIHQNIGDWLEQIGYIPQMIFMLDDSIRSNVAFGEPPDKISDEKVWKALEEAAVADFVRKLPKGLDTQIGERGMRLSGGQRQRIGIARALYRNPKVLIFDEATSALDKETESAIMDSIHSLHGQKTMIIIAHRLTTIEACDHIFRVAEETIVKER